MTKFFLLYCDCCCCRLFFQKSHAVMLSYDNTGIMVQRFNNTGHIDKTIYDTSWCLLKVTGFWFLCQCAYHYHCLKVLVEIVCFMISAPISPWDSSSSLQVDVIDTTRSHEWMNLGHIQCENSMQQFATVLRLNNSLKRCASVGSEH